MPLLISSNGRNIGDWIWVGIAVAWFTLIPKWYTYAVAKKMRGLAETGLSRGSTGFQELSIDEQGIQSTLCVRRGAALLEWSGTLCRDD
ncbi:MAG: hypothetical protein ABJE10_13995 [bacterium]